MYKILEINKPQYLNLTPSDLWVLSRNFADQFEIPDPSSPVWASAPRKKVLRQRILAWSLLERMCREYPGKSLSSLKIERDDHGKPFSSAYPELFFNISHCEQACAVILDDKPCGIDVEDRFSCKDSLIQKVCHSDEYQMLKSLNPEERLLQFQMIWSIKEALLKKEGSGIVYGLEKVNLTGLLPLNPLESAPSIKNDGHFLYEGPDFSELKIYQEQTYTLAAVI